MIVSEEDLLKFTGYKSRGCLETWLREQGIHYFLGKERRLFTTLGLMEDAKMRKRGSHVPRESPQF